MTLVVLQLVLVPKSAHSVVEARRGEAAMRKAARGEAVSVKAARGAEAAMGEDARVGTARGEASIGEAEG